MSSIAVSGETEGSQPLSRRLVLLMACASGFIVANLYYLQPILADVARAFNVSQSQIGFAATLTQIGYALGMLLIVPLGDTVNRHKLIVGLVAALALALIATGFSGDVIWFALATFAIGATAVAAQVIVPFSASLAAPQHRGAVVGTVMSGLLIGILLARTFSGIIGEYFGWRAVYGLAAALTIGTAIMLRLALPNDPPRPGQSYGELMRSLITLFRSLPALRESSLFGAMVFGAFNVFWVSLAFYLETPPYHYGSDVAGLFGLVGVVGALAASVVGRIADHMPARQISGIGLLLVLASFGVYWAFGGSLWGLAFGVILLDLGVQGAHIANQTRVYALVPEARSRLNTVYMVTYFIGGASGSALSAVAWSNFGWPGVCMLGMAFAVVGLAVWVAGSLRSAE